MDNEIQVCGTFSQSESHCFGQNVILFALKKKKKKKTQLESYLEF